MDDRERFAANALFCRKQASLLKDPDAIAQWERLAQEYERLAVNPAAAQSSMISRPDGRSAEAGALDPHPPDGEQPQTLQDADRIPTARGSTQEHRSRWK